MNLENYKRIEMVAVKCIETGKFSFVCQANKEGIKACEAEQMIGNRLSKDHYEMVYFPAYLKKDYIEIVKL